MTNFKLKPDAPLSEYQECSLLWKWVMLRPEIYNCMFHIPNEGKRTMITGHILKMIGLRAGVPDYFIAKPSGKYHGMFLEMKRITERRKPLRENQQKWLNHMYTLGYHTALCFGATEAVAAITQYINHPETITTPEKKDACV
jgi:VRR-NUC domain.